MQHTVVCLCGHPCASSHLTARNYPGPSSRSLLHAASGKITVRLKRRKIKLLGQGGSVFSLSGFSVSEVSVSPAALYRSGLLLPYLIRSTKHGGTVQPRVEETLYPLNSAL